MSQLVGVVGSRSLPRSRYPLVVHAVSSLLKRGYRVGTGGAMGADAFVLEALLAEEAAFQGVVFSAWRGIFGFPSGVSTLVSLFQRFGGEVVWGSGDAGSLRQQVVQALFERSRRLVSSSSQLVAFLFGPSRGTLFTIRLALSRGIPVTVFLCGGGASVPPDLAPHCVILDQEEVSLTQRELETEVMSLVEVV